MDYEQKYKEALETVQEILSSGAGLIRIKRLKLRLQSVFPELKESKDERIRKVLLNDFKNNCSEYYCDGVNRDMIINWLEKQGEKLDADALRRGALWADAHPHWISVEEELPIDYEPVLAVVGGNHFAFVGICLNKTTWYCEIQNKATEIIGITHWMPLPPPPKEGGQTL